MNTTSIKSNYTLTFDGTDVVQLSGYDINKLNDDYIKEVIESNMTVANVSGNVSFNLTNIEEDFLRFAKKNLNIPEMKLFKIESTGF